MKQIQVPVKVDNYDLIMELTTGTSVSLISEMTYNKLWTDQELFKLKPLNVRLKTYTGDNIEVLGTIVVTVCYEDQHESLSLLVVKREGSNLFGRDWLDKIKLNLAQIKFFSRSPISSLDSVLSQHAELN